jgi:hypothetical protein
VCFNQELFQVCFDSRLDQVLLNFFSRVRIKSSVGYL